MATPTDTRGWIKLHRDILAKEKNKKYKFCPGLCWVDLLMSASWKPTTVWTNGRRVQLDRGEMAISLVDLQARWRYGSKRTVMRRLNEMESEGKIAIKRSHLINVIKVVDYNKYQGELIAAQGVNQCSGAIEGGCTTAYEVTRTTDCTTGCTTAYVYDKEGCNTYSTLPHIFDFEHVDKETEAKFQGYVHSVTVSETELKNGYCTTANDCATEAEVAKSAPLVEPTPLNIYNNKYINTHNAQVRTHARESQNQGFAGKNFKEKSEPAETTIQQKLQGEKLSEKESSEPDENSEKKAQQNSGPAKELAVETFDYALFYSQYLHPNRKKDLEEYAQLLGWKRSLHELMLLVRKMVKLWKFECRPMSSFAECSWYLRCEILKQIRADEQKNQQIKLNSYGITTYNLGGQPNANQPGSAYGQPKRYQYLSPEEKRAKRRADYNTYEHGILSGAIRC